MKKTCKQCHKEKNRVYGDVCESCKAKNRIEQKRLSAPLKKCECDDPSCTEMIPSIGKNGYPIRFKEGHQSRGKNSGSYRKGWFMKGNYKILTGYKGHPNASKKGEIPEHVLVMCNHLGRPLTKTEVVHHLDPVREGYCNNDISNLTLTDRSKHQNTHNPRKDYRKDMTGIICIECGSDTTYPSKNGQPHWCRHPITKEEYVCEKCYKRISAQVRDKVLYRRKDLSGRVCSSCGAEKSESKSGQSTWKNDKKGGHICQRCYDKQIRENKKKKQILSSTTAGAI
jgi:hypothetical protein